MQEASAVRTDESRLTPDTQTSCESKFAARTMYDAGTQSDTEATVELRVPRLAAAKSSGEGILDNE